MPRLTRNKKKELATAQLLETAKALFLERGYHRSSLDEIAEAAGFTKGAVYSRFASKDDLFLALIDLRHEEIAAVFDMATNYKTFEEFALHDAQRLVELRRTEADWYLVLIEFWTYAARDARLRREFAARHNQALSRIAARVEAIADRLGVTLRLPALEMARTASAMSQGFTLERLADPVGVPETLLESMFAMLAHEAAADSARTSQGRSEKATRPGRVLRSERRSIDGNTHQPVRTKAR